MRRTVTSVTLILLLLAVAGVTAAQDGAFGPDRTETTTEETAPEPTTPEPTAARPAAPETTDPEATVERPQERTLAEPEAAPSEEPGKPGWENGGGAPATGESGQADGPGGEPEGRGEPESSGGPEERGGRESRAPGDERGESGGAKVTLCHEGKTLSVGAPAEPAHLAHGDSSGPC